jgi:multidrug resistance efflux pump
MYQDDNFEKRSEDVQEILGTPPPWLLRWGTVVAFVGFALLAWLSYWVEYPDIVREPIRITFKDPPVRFRAQEGNYIGQVLVRDNQRVQANQALMTFRTSANFNHILFLSDRIKNLPNEEDSTLAAFSLDTVLILGELQEDLYNFYEKQSEYRQARMKQATTKDIQSLQRQINSLESAISARRTAQGRNADQIDRMETDLRFVEMQYQLGRVSLAEVTALRNRISSMQEEQQALDAAIRDRQFEINSLRGRIGAVEQGSIANQSVTSTALFDSFLKLKLRVNAFIKANILIAPFTGSVQITGRNMAAGQFVQEGDELLVVLPRGERQLIGEMLIPFEKSGQVRTGQRVAIRVNGYPYAEYGSVMGLVSWKSKVARNEGNRVVVPIEIKLPQPLVTHTNKPIYADEELSGDARIITADRRFIERILGSPSNWKLKW